MVQFTISGSSDDLRNVFKETFARFVRIENKLDQLTKELQMDFAKLTASVKSTTDAEDSAVTLLNGLSQMIKDAAGDPTKLAAITDGLDTGSAKLAAAVLANTPAATIS